jgi:hypothetical protein
MPDYVMVPVAVGELFDKISILEIKMERIADASKLANVSAELELLNSIAMELDCAGDEAVNSLRAELKVVNEAIWDAENVVRQVAREGKFGESFGSVARLTYSNNDRRAAIKRKLSLLLGSLIIEEKSHSVDPAPSGGLGPSPPKGLR